jgi:ATP sulfurylase
VTAARKAPFRGTGASITSAPSWELTPRQLCDFELVATGAFAPLKSFMGQVDYESVCGQMRLGNGTLWPIPVMLDVPADVVRSAARRGTLVLKDHDGTALATLSVEEAWRPDHRTEAQDVLGTTQISHPWVHHLLRETHPWYVSGQLSVLRLPTRHGLSLPVHTPEQVKAEFDRRGWRRVVAFNTRNPMHGAHRALVLRAAEVEDANILIHPVIGPTRPGDIPGQIRARCYEAIMRTLPPDRAMVSLLPLAMRMAGPREALWHAIVRRNYGATAFVVGRDHAGPGTAADGRRFYDPYEAQSLVARHQEELGIHVLAARELWYVDGLGYLPDEEIPPGRPMMRVSGTKVRELLVAGADIPAWLMPPEVAAELRRAFPCPR